MADKNINISINTKADTAAVAKTSKELEQLRSKAEEMRSVIADAGEGSLPGWERDLAALEELIAAKERDIATTEEAIQAAAEEAATLEELEAARREELNVMRELEQARNIENIARRQMLGQIREMGSDLQKLGGKLIASSEQIASVDPKLAKTIRTLGETSSAVGTVTQSMAAGALVAGPWGAAIAGTGSAAMLAAQHFIQASADITAKTAEIDAEFAKLIGRQRELGEAAGEESWRAFIDGMDSGAEATRRQNEELEANLRLKRALADLNLEREEADANRRKAEIDADPELSEADKIRRKGAIDEEMAGKRFNHSQARIDDEVSEARRVADQKRQQQAEARDRTTSAQDEMARLEAEQAEVDKAKRRREAAKVREESLARELSDLPQKAEKPMWQRGLEIAGGGPLVEAFTPSVAQKELDERRRQLEQEIEKAKNAAHVSPETAQREGRITGALESSRADVERLRREEEAARMEANKAGTDARIAEELGQARKETGKSIFLDQSFTRQRGAQSAAERAEQAAEERERKRREAEEKQAAKAQREAERAERQQTSEARGIGRDARGLVKKGVNPALAQKIEDAATALDDGATGDELAALAQPLERLAQAATQKDAAMKTQLGQLSKRIEQLAKQVANGRSTTR